MVLARKRDLRAHPDTYQEDHDQEKSPSKGKAILALSEAFGLGIKGVRAKVHEHPFIAPLGLPHFMFARLHAFFMPAPKTMDAQYGIISWTTVLACVIRWFLGSVGVFAWHTYQRGI